MAQYPGQTLDTASTSGPLAYSCITRMELLGYPGLTDEELHAIQTMLADLRYIPLTRAVEDRAIALRQQYRIKLPDAVIAATALEEGYRLLTLDQGLLSFYQQAGN